MSQCLLLPPPPPIPCCRCTSSWLGGVMPMAMFVIGYWLCLFSESGTRKLGGHSWFGEFHRFVSLGSDGLGVVPGCNTHRFRTWRFVSGMWVHVRTWIEGRQGAIPRGHPHPKGKSRRVLYPPPTPHHGAGTKSRRCCTRRSIVILADPYIRIR